MARLISTLPVGSIVKSMNTLYFNNVMRFIVGHQTTERTKLVLEKVLANTYFDGKEPQNPDSTRQVLGSNRYAVSNIDQWLNSLAGAGVWYSARYTYDAPPTKANCYEGTIGYDTRPGFFSLFEENFRNVILSSTIRVAKNTITDGGGYEDISRKVYLLSRTEVGLGNENGVAEGTPWNFFNSDSNRLALGEYKLDGTTSSIAKQYYLRTPYCSGSGSQGSPDIVRATGTLSNTGANHGTDAVRPALEVPSSVLVSDEVDTDGAYIILWSHPPTVPLSITIPEMVHGGESLTVSWEISSDDDENLSGYTLERQYDGGVWSQIYKGINRTFSDSITFGWTSVAYRVKAYDSVGAESDYQTSATRTVINNTAPVISGSNGDLGEKTGAFNQSYTVTDTDSGQTITVVEKIDGTQKRSFTATSGQNYSINVTAAEWLQILNGSHSLTITATDDYGGTTTRTYTFLKNVTEIEFTLASPLPADALITKAIMSVIRQIPAGAIFTVEVCNNGNDAPPTWENVTTAVLGSNKFFFTNAVKTAAEWGYNFRVKVNRNGATGDCYIASVGGNFE